MEFVTDTYDDGSSLDLIYLDFSKAFDKVPHEKLMKKAKAIGISGNLLRWIEQWLTGRRQRVVINGKSSGWIDVESGVPQGSILGPILFVIFINDIDNQITNLINIIRKFADDTKLGHKVNNEAGVLQLCLDILFQWTIDWGMEFNIPKCKVLHIGRNNNHFKYYLNNIELKSVTEEKDIGVITHASLKPSVQCSNAARKANFVLGQISRTFHYRDHKTFLDLYKRYVRPHLEFSVQVWSPWKQDDIKIIENVQKRAVNMVTGLSKDLSYPAKLQLLGLETLEERRHRLDMINTYKILNSKMSVDPNTWFSRVQDNSSRVTRLSQDASNLTIRQSNTEVRKNFFSNRAVRGWNALPTETRNLKTLNMFKSALINT